MGIVALTARKIIQPGNLVFVTCVFVAGRAQLLLPIYEQPRNL